VELEVPTVRVEQLEADFLGSLRDVAGNRGGLVLRLVGADDHAIDEEQVRCERAPAYVQPARHSALGHKFQHSAEVKNVESTL
jgi:hypothetical protein